MKKITIASLCFTALCALTFGAWSMTHASTTKAAAVVASADEAPTVTTDVSDIPAPEGWIDAGGNKAEQMACSGADSRCKSNNFFAACGTTGHCVAPGCCCPAARMCRSGSFPFCCPSGTQCRGNGTPYLECR